MTSIFFDPKSTDDTRRAELYDGSLFVHSPTPSSLELAGLARELAEEAFAPHDPREAQHFLPVETYAAILTELKPRFIHDPRAKKFIPGILEELGCDLEQTYFDVPRLRTATHGDYLSSGIAYAFQAHRDTWYSTPMCQINWWLPAYSIEASNTMAFHPLYWNRAIKNSSREFNYQEWNRDGRKNAAKHLTRDSRKQSAAEEPLSLEPDLRLIVEPGSIVVFSAAHLHSTVPNTSGQTRLSIDFRTVNLADLQAGSGAPNLDSQSDGTTILDYLRGTDLTQLPSDIVERYSVTGRAEPVRVEPEGACND